MHDAPSAVAPLPRTRADAARALAMPILLVAVALLGTARAITLDQSSWQGASFGMFATYDNRSSRFVVIEIDGASGRRRVRAPAHLEDDVTRLAVVPTDAAAQDLAEEILQVDDGASSSSVQVWRIQIQQDDGLSMRGSLLVSVRAGR